MWNPFKSAPLLQAESLRFQIDTFKWLLKNYGGDAFFKETDLILPTKDFFPESAQDPTETAEITFRYVKRYAGMEEWPCKLEAQDPDPDYKVAPTTIIKPEEHSPAGTYSDYNLENVIITYNPSIVSSPNMLIATFAHELAHFLTASCKEHPPGGWENWEFATDITAVFMGFGIFSANSAFSFSQFSDGNIIGWNSSNSGYLSEPEFSFALAIFLKLKNIEPTTIYQYLDLNIKTYVKKSIKELNKTEYFKELTNVKYDPQDS